MYFERQYLKKGTARYTKGSLHHLLAKVLSLSLSLSLFLSLTLPLFTTLLFITERDRNRVGITLTLVGFFLLYVHTPLSLSLSLFLSLRFAESYNVFQLRICSAHPAPPDVHGHGHPCQRCH